MPLPHIQREFDSHLHRRNTPSPLPQIPHNNCTAPPHTGAGATVKRHEWHLLPSTQQPLPRAPLLQVRLIARRRKKLLQRHERLLPQLPLNRSRLIPAPEPADPSRAWLRLAFRVADLEHRERIDE